MRSFQIQRSSAKRLTATLIELFKEDPAPKVGEFYEKSQSQLRVLTLAPSHGSQSDEEGVRPSVELFPGEHLLYQFVAKHDDGEIRPQSEPQNRGIMLTSHGCQGFVHVLLLAALPLHVGKIAHNRQP